MNKKVAFLFCILGRNDLYVLMWGMVPHTTTKGIIECLALMSVQSVVGADITALLVTAVAELATASILTLTGIGSASIATSAVAMGRLTKNVPAADE